MNDINDAPILSGTPAVLANGTEDIAYTINASDLLQGYSDADGDTLSITSVTTASANGSITDNGDSTWTYLPTTDLNGEVSFSFVVSDGNGETANGSTTLTLNSVDDEVILDADNNGIADSSELSAYQLISGAGAVAITNKGGETYNDAWTSRWDVAAAVQVGEGFQVLLEGTGVMNDQFNVLKTNADGVITKYMGWKSADELVEQGMESIFGVDLNSYGLI